MTGFRSSSHASSANLLLLLLQIFPFRGGKKRRIYIFIYCSSVDDYFDPDGQRIGSPGRVFDFFPIHFMLIHGCDICTRASYTIVDPVCARAGSRFAVLRHRGRERVRDTGEQRDHEMQDTEFRVRVRTGGSMGGRRWNGLHGRRGLR